MENEQEDKQMCIGKILVITMFLLLAALIVILVAV